MGFDSIPVPSTVDQEPKVHKIVVSIDQEAIVSKVALAMAEFVDFLNGESDLIPVDECVAGIVERYAGDNEELSVVLVDRLKDCLEMDVAEGEKRTLSLQMINSSEGGPAIEDFNSLVEEVGQFLRGVTYYYSAPENRPPRDEELQERANYARAQMRGMAGF